MTSRPTAVPSLIAKCGACALHKGCSTPKFPVKGKGKLGVMIVLDNPTSSEDESGEVLNGESGQELIRLFSQIGIDVLRDCWITYAAICHGGNAIYAPKKPVSEYCRPNLVKAINVYNPRIVIPMGAMAIGSVVTHTWEEKAGETFRYYGYQIPSQKINAWICPMISTKQILSELPWDRPVLEINQQNHIKALTKILDKGRPWKEIPDYASKIQIITDDASAAVKIREYARANRAAAFDYEANFLKPEWRGAYIKSASISISPTDTISFLMRGEAETAMKEFLVSPVPKIAANMKYEVRASLCILKTRPRNMLIDTMFGQHVYDNRRGTKGLKFIAYVRLGFPYWAGAVESYLESVEGSHFNRIEEIDTHQLLEYGGIDSHVERIIAYKQYSRIFGRALADSHFNP